MKQSGFKKLTIIFLVIILVLLGVMIHPKDKTKEDELSKIKASPQKGTEQQSEKSIFSPVENEFGYTLKEYNNPRANMTLLIPSSWGVYWESDREIDLTTPDNDKFLKNTSISIRYDFEKMEAMSSMDMINAFKDELYRTKYFVDGETMAQQQYFTPTINTDTKFTNGHDNMVACAETKDIRMCIGDSSGKSYTGYTKVDYYVNWYDLPCVFSCVVRTEEADKTKRILGMLASNIKYCEQNMTDTGKTLSLDNDLDIQLTLPHQFQIQRDGKYSAFYSSPRNSRTVFSGMSVGMYTYSTGEGMSINYESIADQYGYVWIGECLDMSTLSPAMTCELEESRKYNDKHVNVYDVEYVIVAKDNGYDNYFIPGETWRMKICTIFGKEMCEVMAINYQDCQQPLVDAIIELNFPK